jgi:hypothetical protein
MMRGTGYLISIISVLLLGAGAWPRPDEPQWKILALLGGVAASIVGMGLRWLASRKQLSELHSVERKVARPEHRPVPHRTGSRAPAA